MSTLPGRVTALTTGATMGDNTMNPNEVVDLALQLIAEAGFYDARVFNVFDRLPLDRRGIMAATLLQCLPPILRLEVRARHATIERMMNKIASVE